MNDLQSFFTPRITQNTFVNVPLGVNDFNVTDNYPFSSASWNGSLLAASSPDGLRNALAPKRDAHPPNLHAVRLDGPYTHSLLDLFRTTAFMVAISGMLGYVLGVLSVIWWPR